jgi:hypothetical protein
MKKPLKTEEGIQVFAPFYTFIQRLNAKLPNKFQKKIPPLMKNNICTDLTTTSRPGNPQLN